MLRLGEELRAAVKTNAMTDLCDPKEGTMIFHATSTDESNPPEAMIDGNPSTFWLTTGMFPQEFIITFRSVVQIDSIMMKSTNIKKLKIERSEDANAGKFKAIMEKELESRDDGVQIEEFKFTKHVNARHLKMVILKALDHFVSIHSVSVTGRFVR